MAAATTRAQCLLGLRRRAPLPFPLLPRAAPHRRGAHGLVGWLSSTVAVTGVEGPVWVVAAPSLPEADFRNAVDSALFKQWLRNPRTEKGVLTYGRLNLGQILIQGVDMFGKRAGFLKSKADIVDEETKAKIEEETGIKLNSENMVDLTAMLDPATGCRMFPSPGDCDEEIGLFLYREHVDEETIKGLPREENRPA